MADNDHYRGTPHVREDIVNQDGPATIDDGETLTYHLDDEDTAKRREIKIKEVFGNQVEVHLEQPDWCANCHYFDGPNCRRFPPPLQEVSSTDWCGEFRLRQQRRP